MTIRPQDRMSAALDRVIDSESRVRDAQTAKERARHALAQANADIGRADLAAFDADAAARDAYADAKRLANELGLPEGLQCAYRDHHVRVLSGGTICLRRCAEPLEHVLGEVLAHPQAA